MSDEDARRTTHDSKWYWESLESGDVIEFAIPYQESMHLRKVSDTGKHAYEVQHPQSELFVYGAVEGELYAAGVIESEKAAIRDVISLTEAADRGVFNAE